MYKRVFIIIVSGHLNTAKSHEIHHLLHGHLKALEGPCPKTTTNRWDLDATTLQKRIF